MRCWSSRQELWSRQHAAARRHREGDAHRRGSPRKAMYIEYYLAVDGPNQGVNAEPWARDRVGRYGQDPRFDAEGNVWLVDRGIPHPLVKLDPRTGQQREWLYPDPRNGNHEILIDPSG
ncbi:MAG: hypothetical protein Ct9H300mP25_15420 [Acidobacteriota bacterium]|nr:MAG: hypothetical protein Ct9H300mP25_15420 [Acidobacteriota bacterium]